MWHQVSCEIWNWKSRPIENHILHRQWYKLSCCMPTAALYLLALFFHLFRGGAEETAGIFCFLLQNVMELWWHKIYFSHIERKYTIKVGNKLIFSALNWAKIFGFFSNWFNYFSFNKSNIMKKIHCCRKGEAELLNNSWILVAKICFN